LSAYPQGSNNLDPSLLGRLIGQNAEDLAREHVNLLWKQIKAFLDLVAQELMDGDVADALFRFIVILSWRRSLPKQMRNSAD